MAMIGNGLSIRKKFCTRGSKNKKKEQKNKIPRELKI